MKNSVTFRLLTDKKEGTWSIRGGSAKKNGVLKSINYRPGVDSIFDEDNKDSIVKPVDVLFRYNDILSDPAVEIIVPIENKVLIDYLMAHPYYGIHYGIHDLEEIAKKESASYDDIEKALSLIKETDELKIQAMALAVFGREVYGLSPNQCAAKLKEKAITSALVIIKKFESPSYETDFLAALSFFSEIVKEDMTNTAVVWNDEKEGLIIHIAKGENGIDKLAEFFANESDETRVVIQEISSRLDKKKKAENAVSQPARVNQADTKLIKSQAEKIAELEAKLAAKEDAPVAPTPTPETPVEEIEVVDEVEVVDENVVSIEDMTIEQARAAYLVKFEKAVPAIKNKDLAWIKTKLAK